MKKKYEWSKLFDIFFIINASSDIVWNDKYSSVKFVWEMSGKLLLLCICVLAYIFLFQACDKKNKFYNIFSPLFTVIMISKQDKKSDLVLFLNMILKVEKIHYFGYFISLLFLVVYFFNLFIYHFAWLCTFFIYKSSFCKFV